MEAPGFWDDSERAREGLGGARPCGAALEMFETLESDVEELDGLAELAEEDESMAG